MRGPASPSRTDCGERKPGAAACITAYARSVTCQEERAKQPKQTVWDKARTAMEEMPEDFPPRVMFDNIEAMKANTDEILTLMKAQALVSTSAP